MALTDNEKTKDRKPKIRSVDAGTNRSWSDKQKIEAVQSYLLLGNLALTSRILKIPEITLRVWKTTEWWKNVVDDLRQQESMEMSGRLRKIVDASLVAVEDRLLNGDLMYDNKTGQMVRKPVNMRDAHKVAVDLMDKKKLLDKEALEGPQEQQDDDRLLKLAEKFASLVQAKTEKPVEIIDVEDVQIKEAGLTPSSLDIEEKQNAIHDQRQEGLQEGEREVQLQARDSESSLGTDSAPSSS
jgi:transposase-like protein